MRPVPPYPVTFSLRDVDGFGWSETYWWNNPSMPLASNLQILNLAQARMGLSTNAVTLFHIRVGSGKPRFVDLWFPNSGSGYPGTLSAPRAPTEVAAEVLLTGSAPGPFAKVFVRGLAEINVSGNNFVADPTWNANFSLYANLVAASPWSVYGTLGTTPTFYPFFNGMPTVPRGFTFTSPTFTGVVGQTIRVHGTRVPGYAGRKTITQVTPGSPPTYTCGGAAPAAADNTAGAQISTVTYTTTQIATVTVQGLSRRAAGRPFGQSRGRRPTTYPLRA